MRWESPIDPLAERLAGAGRILLGTIAYAVLQFEPVGVFRNQQALSAITTAYLIYAVVAELTRVALQVRVRWYRIATHVLDVLFAIALVWTAGELSTPTRMFSLFAIMSAAVRFSWRVIVATAAVMVALNVAMAVRLSEEPGFQLFTPGSSTVVVLFLAAAFWYLKVRSEQRRVDLELLAAWPRTPLPDGEDLLRETLEYAALVMRSRSAVLIWEDFEEPFTRVATWSAGRFSLQSQAPEKWQPLIAEPLQDESFYSIEVHKRLPRVYYRRGDRVAVYRGAPIHGDLAAELGARSVLSVCVEGDSIEGRLFLVDLPLATTEAVLTAEVIGDLIAARIHQGRAMRQGQAAAVAEERVRLARDLHDGLLQSLTGVALHLQSVGKLVHSDPESAARSIEEIQEVIAADQRGLRSFIQQLRPFQSSRIAALRLTGRLGDLGTRYRTQFGLEVELHTESLSPFIGDAMRHEIFSLVNEAVANVAKHANASRVRIELYSAGDEVAIRVEDDGTGFPFSGTYELTDLLEMRRGPQTLMERVAALSGRLRITSTSSGSVVEMRVPTALERA